MFTFTQLKPPICTPINKSSPCLFQCPTHQPVLRVTSGAARKTTPCQPPPYVRRRFCARRHRFMEDSFHSSESRKISLLCPVTEMRLERVTANRRRHSSVRRHRRFEAFPTFVALTGLRCLTSRPRDLRCLFLLSNDLGWRSLNALFTVAVSTEIHHFILFPHAGQDIRASDVAFLLVSGSRLKHIKTACISWHLQTQIRSKRMYD